MFLEQEIYNKSWIMQRADPYVYRHTNGMYYFEKREINPEYTPAVLCKNHGPFTWGKDAAEALHNAVVLEEVAKMARNTEALNKDVEPAPAAKELTELFHFNIPQRWSIAAV